MSTGKEIEASRSFYRQKKTDFKCRESEIILTTANISPCLPLFINIFINNGKHGLRVKEDAI